mgnify:CR=1 FL=1
MLENIQITKKDVKNITLKVKPSGEVILTAPKITSDEHIKFIIKKRAKWNDKKKEGMEWFEKSKKKKVFMSGIMKKHYFIFSIFYKSLIKLWSKR